MGSPFLLFFLILLLRGYFSDIMSSHRAKAAFKQNLESATPQSRGRFRRITTSAWFTKAP